MSPSRASEIASWYDELADLYDEMYAGEQKRKHRLVVSLLNLSEGSVVLDAGCGTGRFLALICGRCSAVVGLDISHRQIAAAHAKLRGASNSLLVIGDFERPPFRERAFTAVVAVTSIHHSSDAVGSAAKLIALAKERAVFTILKHAATKELLEAFTSLPYVERIISEAKDYVVACTTRAQRAAGLVYA